MELVQIRWYGLMHKNCWMMVHECFRRLLSWLLEGTRDRLVYMDHGVE